MTHFPCSLLLHCSLGRPFHWPSAVVSPLPGCELSFCSSSLTTSYSTPNFTLEKVFCSTVHSILCGAQKSNCKPVLTKQGVGRKRSRLGWSRMPHSVIRCSGSWYLVWVFGQEREVSVKWLLQSQRGLDWQKKMSFVALLVQVIFRPVHGAYCWSYSLTLAALSAVTLVKLCLKKKKKKQARILETSSDSEKNKQKHYQTSFSSKIKVKIL